VSIGTANSCPVHPRKVLQRAILCGAVSLLVAHNHPSGVLTPSREDINTTRLLRNACDAVGIKLLDHLIVSDTDLISINES
jgi:DNA repair protein RadC